MEKYNEVMRISVENGEEKWGFTPSVKTTQETKIMDWQPIETAPKDGTQILCYEFCYGQDTMYLADYAWHGSVEKGSFYSMGDLMQPTHWMPMQAPPKID